MYSNINPQFLTFYHDRMCFMFDLENIQQCIRHLYTRVVSLMSDVVFQLNFLLSDVKRYLLELCCPQGTDTNIQHTSHVYQQTEYLKLGSKHFGMVWVMWPVRTSWSCSPPSNSGMVSSGTLLYIWDLAFKKGSEYWCYKKLFQAEKYPTLYILIKPSARCKVKNALRYVMLGNHRDAWGFGAVDPSSGTAQMMEVVRPVTCFSSPAWRHFLIFYIFLNVFDWLIRLMNNVCWQSGSTFEPTLVQIWEFSLLQTHIAYR